jgi:hypothetical protein
MRRLKEQVASLRRIAQELISLEGEHVDDRKQAEKEAERLGKLIASTRATIDSMKEEAKNKKRSYAIIPYDGRHGTQRRPIYIECRKDEVILQPEGIHLTPDDFREPLGAGNPLAAALRAAREYIVREDGGTIGAKETEPYPLILVRPEGIIAYYKVREAIESWDAAFGYELIDNDWSLEFPPSNPLLAEIEQHAVENSRTRQQMLIAAAPRAYGMRRMSGGGADFEDEELTNGDEADDGSSGSFAANDDGGAGNGDSHYRDGGAGGNGPNGSYAVDVAANGQSGEFFAEGLPTASRAGTNQAGEGFQRSDAGGEIHDGTVRIPNAGTTTTPNGANGPTGTGQGSGPVGPSPSVQTGATAIGQQPGTSTTIVAGTAAADGTSSFGAPPPAPVSATGGSVADGVGEASLMAGDRSASGSGQSAASGNVAGNSSTAAAAAAPLAMQMNKPRHSSSHTRGQDWAIHGKAPNSTPVRRTIRVIVRSERLVIQPDATQSGRTAKGQEILLKGPTVESLDEFVAAVQDRVHEWDIAGDKLYWRPVLALSIAPDGKGRAEDLARLLRNSGIEIDDEAMATRPHEVQPNATR